MQASADRELFEKAYYDSKSKYEDICNRFQENFALARRTGSVFVAEPLPDSMASDPFYAEQYKTLVQLKTNMENVHSLTVAMDILEKERQAAERKITVATTKRYSEDVARVVNFFSVENDQNIERVRVTIERIEGTTRMTYDEVMDFSYKNNVEGGYLWLLVQGEDDKVSVLNKKYAGQICRILYWPTNGFFNIESLQVCPSI